MHGNKIKSDVHVDLGSIVNMHTYMNMHTHTYTYIYIYCVLKCSDKILSEHIILNKETLEILSSAF